MTLRCPVLISAVIFIPGASLICLPSTSMLVWLSFSMAGKIAPRFSSFTASCVTLSTLAFTVP